MRFLLDTHVLLWWLFDDPKLSLTARDLIVEPDHLILISAASAWEISTKHRLGKLPAAEELLQDFEGWVRRAGFQELTVTLEHGRLAGGFPQDHRDPFDRMLAAQSLLEHLPLVTRDPALKSFDIEVLW